MSVYYNDIDGFCCDVLRKNIERGQLPKGRVDDRDIKTIKLSELRRFKQWHLFAGIGGFPYGLRLAGMPDDFEILTGGFPCQPFSLAGKQRGAADDRHLWPAMFAAIAYLRPRWVLGENVFGIVKMELDQVLLDLESCGYTAWPLVIPACATDAPHRRDRVWIVAHHDGQRQQKQRQPVRHAPQDAITGGSREDVADSQGARRKTCGGNGMGTGQRTERAAHRRGEIANADAAPMFRPEIVGLQPHGVVPGDVQVGRLGLAGETPADGDAGGIEWLPEPRVGRVATGVPRRVDRLRALGNAVVPQVVAELGRLILEADHDGT